MARAIRISDNRIDINEGNTTLFSVTADADIIAMKLRAIQLASTITGVWTYSEAGVAKAINMILELYNGWATDILKEFDVFNTANKEVKCEVSDKMKLIMKAITKTGDTTEFLFEKGIESPGILFQPPESIGLNYPTVFASNNISTIKDLINLTPLDLKYMRGIGDGNRFNKIVEQLRSVGLSLSHSDDTVWLLKFSKERSLFSNGIKSFGDLQQKTEKDILNMYGIGDTCLEELKTRMAIFGLKLRSESGA